MPPPSSKNSILAVVGEGPGANEVKFGANFIGPSGDFFDRCLDVAGITRGDCHVTNATLCFPRGFSDADVDQAVQCCKPRLHRELKRLKTRTVLAYGQGALESLTGKRNLHDWCGAPLTGRGPFTGFRVLGAYHPAHVIRPDGADLAPTVFVMTKRAVQLAKGKLPAWRWARRIIYPGIQAVRALQSILEEKADIGFDTETRGTDPMRDLCMALGVANRKVAVCVPWEGYSSRKFFQPALDTYPYGRRIAKLVTEILGHRQITKVMHNQSHDVLAAERLGLDVRGPTYDTLPASNLVLPGAPHDLGFMMAVETHAPRHKSIFGASGAGEKGAEKFSKQDPKVLRDYCCKDCLGTLELRDHLEWHLADMPKGNKLQKLYMDLEPVTLKMTRSGIRRDREKMAIHAEHIGRRSKHAADQIEELASHIGMSGLNPNAPGQMNALFYGRLGVKPRHFSKNTGRPSLNEAALTDMLGDENDITRHLARAMLRHRKNQALKKFVDPSKLYEDDVLHVEHKQYGARTFRWSTSPNLQNIPKPVLVKHKRTGALYVKTPGLRDTFIPHKDGDWMVAADYDQIELKLLAMMADDEAMLDVFRSGGDPHRAAGADLFDIPSEEVEKNERDMAKIAQYEIWYYGSVETLWKHIVAEFPRYTLRQARKQYRNYKLKHPVDAFHAKCVKEAEDNKFIVAPISGHVLNFFGPIEPPKTVNYRVQHSAADIINPSAIKLSRALDWRREALLAQVHDELLTCGPDPLSLAKKLRTSMTQQVCINGHTLNFGVSVKMGPSWGEVEEVKGDLETGALKIAKKFKGRLNVSW
jgi:DNA polymerase-1